MSELNAGRAKGRAVSRFTGFLVLVSLAASAGTMPSVGLAEIRFRSVDFTGKSLKLIDKLRDGFYSDFRDQQGVAAVSRTIAESYIRDADRKDWADADEALMKFAADRKVDAQYGMYVFVWLEQEGENSRTYLKMSARVVGRDGWRAKDLTVKLPRGDRPLPGIFRTLTAQLFRELELAKLKVTSEAPPPAPVAPPMVVAPPSLPPEEIGARTSVALPVEVKKSEPSVLKPVGYVGLGVGGAALVAGLIVFATTPTIHQNSYGNVLPEDASAFRPAQRQQAAGVGLLIGGGVVAAAGALAAFWLGHDAPVRATFVPASSGGSLVVGGSF